MNSIIIPDSLPEILKNYVKAAIRSQPDDIISWSAEYFKTTDEQCAVMGVQKTDTKSCRQDRTLFRILAFQLGTTVGTKERIEEVWSDLSLDFSLLDEIYRIGKFHGEHVDMVEFLGITFGHWTKSLKETVLLCCEAFCKCLATDGYFMHVDTACKLYGFLAKLDCSLTTGNSDAGHSQTVVALDGRNDDDDDGGDGGHADRPPMTSSQSLDAPVPSKIRKLDGRSATSLESVFERPETAADHDGGGGGGGGGGGDRPEATGYHVPGIGPSVPDGQVRGVFEYFRKCAADNGGYVYDFDIENDHCPPLDADAGPPVDRGDQ